jgi:cohesin loading factor subunit SCC2
VEEARKLDFAGDTEELAAAVLPFLEAARVYLNLASCTNAPKVLIDELLEQSLALVKKTCEKVVLPLVSEKKKDARARSKAIHDCLVCVSSMLDCLTRLAQRHILQDYWLSASYHLFMSLLLHEGDEFLQIPITNLLVATFTYYPNTRPSILEDLMENLPLLTYDPDQTIGSRIRKVNSHHYHISSKHSIHFSTFLVLELLQSACIEDEPIGANGRFQHARVAGGYKEALSFAQFLSNKVIALCSKTGQDCNDYKAIVEKMLADLLRVLCRPEFPLASRLVEILVVQMVNLSSKGNANFRNWVVEQFGIIAKVLKRLIVKTRKHPIIPKYYIETQRETDHPTEDPSLSKCICGKGWGTGQSNMIQCDLCHCWFHNDCMGVDMSKYKEDSWYCDDCSVYQYMRANGGVKRSKRIAEKEACVIIEEDPGTVWAVSREADRATRDHILLFNQLVANYLAFEERTGDLTKGARYFICAKWVASALAQQAKATGDEYDQRDPRLKQASDSWFAHKNEHVCLGKLSERGTVKLFRQMLLSGEYGQLFTCLLGRILTLLNHEQPITRAKALKALAGIVEVDPAALSDPSIEKAVQSKFLDPAISVREAAVELLGRFITVQPGLSPHYYTTLTQRLKDRGSSVRKRVIRILKDIVCSDSAHSQIIPMLSEVVKRMSDETEGIKDCVLASFEQIWFKSGSDIQVATMLLGVCESPLNHDSVVQMLKGVITRDKEAYTAKLRRITDCLVQQLLQNRATRAIVAKTLSLLCSAQADLLVSSVPSLQHFLCPEGAPDEAEVITAMCYIIEQVAGVIGQSDSKVYIGIQTDLLNLVYREGTTVLTAALKALCKVVQCLTSDLQMLQELTKRCFFLLKNYAKPIKIPQDRFNSLTRAFYIIGLVTKEIKIHEGLELEPGRAYVDSVFEVLKYYWDNKDLGVRDRALEALTFVWVQFPHLLYQSESLLTETLKTARAVPYKVHVLTLLKDFLATYDRKMAGETETDHSTALVTVQNYLDPVLVLSLDDYSEVRLVATEVLRLFLKQGHVSRALLVPTLITLFSDDNFVIRGLAMECITGIYQKSPDSVLVNLTDSVRKSFAFEVKLYRRADAHLRTGEPVFAGFFQLLKDKKTQRIKFLSQISQLAGESDDYYLLYFLGCLLTSLHYTQAEEVLTVLGKLPESRLSSAGIPCYDRLKRASKSNQPVSQIEVSQAVQIIFVLSLKSFLHRSYDLRAVDSDKTIHKRSEESGGYQELNEPLLEYCEKESLAGKELYDLRKTLQAYMREEEEPIVAKKRQRPMGGDVGEGMPVTRGKV